MSKKIACVLYITAESCAVLGFIVTLLTSEIGYYICAFIATLLLIMIGSFFLILDELIPHKNRGNRALKKDKQIAICPYCGKFVNKKDHFCKYCGRQFHS